MSKVYERAAEMMDALAKKNGTTLKKFAFGSGEEANVGGGKDRAAYALVCECLKFKPVLEEVMGATTITRDLRAVKHTKLMCMVHDALMGDGIQGGGQLKRNIMALEPQLQAALARVKVKAGARTPNDLLPLYLRLGDDLPRYVRVNPHQTPVPEALSQLSSEGRTGRVDAHIPSLLEFDADSVFHGDELIKTGHAIVQDKASCFPAFILNPAPDADVIDSCAAPGNKTTHLSCVMGPSATGQIFAFDIDQSRLKLLSRNVKRQSATNVVPVLSSFLDANPNDPRFANVKAVLCDPTCSGSGMVKQLDHLSDETRLWRLPAPWKLSGNAAKPVEEVKTAAQKLADQFRAEMGVKKSAGVAAPNGSGALSKKRIGGHGYTTKLREARLDDKDDGAVVEEDDDAEDAEKTVDAWGRIYDHAQIEGLADFQVSVVLHAMSFPKVERVTYSTCSIHDAENEGVVQRILDAQNDFVLEHVLPSYPYRGRVNLCSQGAKTVRSDPQNGRTIGFFVCLFVRRSKKPAKVKEQKSKGDKILGKRKPGTVEPTNGEGQAKKGKGDGLTKAQRKRMRKKRAKEASGGGNPQ